jgi:hypothetical protein
VVEGLSRFNANDLHSAASKMNSCRLTGEAATDNDTIGMDLRFVVSPLV